MTNNIRVKLALDTAITCMVQARRDNSTQDGITMVTTNNNVLLLPPPIPNGLPRRAPPRLILKHPVSSVHRRLLLLLLQVPNPLLPPRFTRNINPTILNTLACIHTGQTRTMQTKCTNNTTADTPMHTTKVTRECTKVKVTADQAILANKEDSTASQPATKQAATTPSETIAETTPKPKAQQCNNIQVNKVNNQRKNPLPRQTLPQVKPRNIPHTRALLVLMV